MTQRTRLASCLVPLLALAALPLGTGAADAAASPVMTGFLDENNAIGLAFADGTQVGTIELPGPVVPPGTYEVDVDDRSQIGNFDLVGTGVDSSTGVDARVRANWTVTLQPCALYGYRNDGQGVSVRWFQTSSSPASTAACPAPLAGTVSAPLPASTAEATNSAAGGSSGGSVSAIGTAIRATVIRGTLHGSIGARGKPALSFEGKPVSKLEAGRYKLTASDATAKGGLAVRKGRGKPLRVTSGSFVGKRTVTLDLRVGSWTFYSPSSPRATGHFTVVAS